MAISPIDIRMMQQTNEVAQIKHNENTRPEAQQNVINREFHKELSNRLEQVNKKENADKSDTKHDAREKGKNSYFSTKDNKKKQSEDTGAVTIKSNSTFDMKI